MANPGKDLPLRTAAGFILVRKHKSGLQYLMLRTARNSEAALPKGHTDSGETEMQTALRETAEESGLTDLDHRRDFRRVLKYEVRRAGRLWRKHVVLFTAYVRSGSVRLSDEHVSYEWLPLEAMYDAMPYLDVQKAIYAAALFLKDPALFDMFPATEDEAYAHLKSLPEATKELRAHLRGGAKLGRRFAEALAEAGRRVHVEATAAGTVLHDVGRALGEHADHQRAGLRHLRKTKLAPYGFACVSHFTKGARPRALREAGLSKDLVGDFRKLIDLRSLTWEERCAALADACMRGAEPVRPKKRFADLRKRYDAPALIDLQETHTESIRAKIERAIGVDPLSLVKLG